jgi:hypothetical protein
MFLSEESVGFLIRMVLGRTQLEKFIIWLVVVNFHGNRIIGLSSSYASYRKSQDCLPFSLS